MEQLLLLTILTSLAILGWHYATLYNAVITNQSKHELNYDQGATNKEIAWFVRYYALRFIAFHAPWLRKFFKPLFACPVCMSGPYGTFSYWLYVAHEHQHLTLLTFGLWIAFLVAVAGLNRILVRIAPAS